MPLLAGRVITVAGVLTLLFLLVTAVRARRRVTGDPALSAGPGKELVVDPPQLRQV